MREILERRSIRNYTNQPVSKESIDMLLRAGMCAPSANNDQPWHFIVINDKQIMHEITMIQPYSQPLKKASYAIIVCGDIQLKKYQEYKDFWIQDCSAATENILIAAESLELGAVWMGLYPVKEWFHGIQRLFDLHENIVPLSLISIGYPAVRPESKDFYVPSKIHINQW